MHLCAVIFVCSDRHTNEELGLSGFKSHWSKVSVPVTVHTVSRVRRCTDCFGFFSNYVNSDNHRMDEPRLSWTPFNQIGSDSVLKATGSHPQIS